MTIRTMPTRGFARLARLSVLLALLGGVSAAIDADADVASDARATPTPTPTNAMTTTRLSPRLFEKTLDLSAHLSPTASSPPTPFDHAAGYFALNRTRAAEMFYFYFRSRDAAADAPVVLWMTGGPGCSSEIALFYENGPYRILDDLTLAVTEHGWDTVSNLIYVDQPINTGFSYSDDPRDDVHDERVVAEDMLDFLSEFVDAHPELRRVLLTLVPIRPRRRGERRSLRTFAGVSLRPALAFNPDTPRRLSSPTDAFQLHPDGRSYGTPLRGRDFYVTGESYAGHYVPAVSYAAFKAQQSDGVGVGMRLKGLAIGNGLTEPEIQYGAYADYGLGVDVVSKAAAEISKKNYPTCAKMIRKCGGGAGSDGPTRESEARRKLCLAAVEYCSEKVWGPVIKDAGDVNVYDVRKRCVGDLCYDMSNADKFLNQPSVKAALGVKRNITWEACDGSVHRNMMADWMRDLEPTIPPMLEAGLRVLIYAGEEDFICNWLGNHRWVRAMEWSGKDAFNDARPEPFVVDGVTGGDVTESGNLAFLRVSLAGHMVPMDQPKNAVVMLKRFVAGEPMSGGEWTPNGSSEEKALLRGRKGKGGAPRRGGGGGGVVTL
jgi:serine carboxypeptidase-like clade 4